MITHLPGMPLPTESTLDITIRMTQPLNVTSFSARQKVTQYVMQELSSRGTFRAMASATNSAST